MKTTLAEPADLPLPPVTRPGRRYQAAGCGRDAVVHLLVERGARPDLKDVLWHATPADWAAHEGQTGIEAYLREKQRKQHRETEQISEKQG